MLALVGCDDPNTGTNPTTTATTDTDATTTEGDTIAPDTTTDVSDPGPVAAHTVTLIDNVEHNIVIGGSTPITFEVPADVISISISVTGDPGVTYGLGKWDAPNGVELVYDGWTSQDQGAGQMCLGCDNRIAVAAGAFATIAPNNPAATVEAGQHTITLFAFRPAVVAGQGGGSCGDDECTLFEQFQGCSDCNPESYTGPARVWVHAKVADTAGAGLPATGVLDLNLHFTGAEGFTAASAPTDSEFQSYLQTMRDIYGTVGITLGEITYRDIDAKFRVIESIDGPESDLQEMFRLSGTNALNALDLYFVEEISSASLGGFGVILGISGGIPGPPLLQGTHRSGVAISLTQDGLPPGVTAATTMAHETGHFLGLFHTSEQSFTGIHDPLPDTPNNDEDYVMFNTGSGNLLSEWQGRVMRSNPWVRHPEAE